MIIAFLSLRQRIISCRRTDNSWEEILVSWFDLLFRLCISSSPLFFPLNFVTAMTWLSKDALTWFSAGIHTEQLLKGSSCYLFRFGSNSKAELLGHATSQRLWILEWYRCILGFGRICCSSILLIVLRTLVIVRVLSRARLVAAETNKCVVHLRRVFSLIGWDYRLRSISSRLWVRNL